MNTIDERRLRIKNAVLVHRLPFVHRPLSPCEQGEIYKAGNIPIPSFLFSVFFRHFHPPPTNIPLHLSFYKTPQNATNPPNNKEITKMSISKTLSMKNMARAPSSTKDKRISIEVHSDNYITVDNRSMPVFFSNLEVPAVIQATVTFDNDRDCQGLDVEINYKATIVYEVTSNAPLRIDTHEHQDPPTTAFLSLP